MGKQDVEDSGPDHMAMTIEVGDCRRHSAPNGWGMGKQDVEDIGPDYAITLRQWRAAWEAGRERVLALGYPPSFWRKYRYPPSPHCSLVGVGTCGHACEWLCVNWRAFMC